MSLAKAKELREERAKLHTEATALLESEEMSAEDETRFDAIMADCDKLEAQIKRLEWHHDAGKDLEARIETRAGREDITTGEAERDMQAENEAFSAWVRGGMQALNDEQRDIMGRRYTNIQAAQSVGTDSAGGYLVPDEYQKKLEAALLAFGGMREVATVVPSSSGGALTLPSMNDTSNEGELLSENTEAGTQDVTFGALVMNAYTYSSKLVPVSLQLLQDSAFPIDTLLTGILADRIGRITNKHFTIGTGSDQPNGIVTASTQGVQGTTGQTTSVTYDDLIELEHSVDPAYRAAPGCGWMMHDTTVKILKKLKDGDSRPLWQPGMAVREPDTINNYKWTVNQHVPVMAASAKSILFGELSKYLIRDVKGVTLLRLTERYAEKLQVGFLAFVRCDGDLLDAGTHPVKHYANSAT